MLSTIVTQASLLLTAGRIYEPNNTQCQVIGNVTLMLMKFLLFTRMCTETTKSKEYVLWTTYTIICVLIDFKKRVIVFKSLNISLVFFFGYSVLTRYDCNAHQGHSVYVGLQPLLYTYSSTAYASLAHALQLPLVLVLSSPFQGIGVKSPSFTPH